MNFVVLTDTHLVPPGRTLYALSPAEYLRSAIEMINRDHPEIAFIIITGDLADLGEPEAYAQLRDMVQSSKLPIKLLLGNHDSRAAFKQAFPLEYHGTGAFVQWMNEYDECTIIALDTLDEIRREDDGVLCDERLVFLKSCLTDANPDKPLLVFQHHPPFEIGVESMDACKLRNPEDQWALFSDIRKPDYMFMGHVHRPIAGVWRGVPYHIQRSSIHQVAFALTGKDIYGSLEAPDYSLVSVRDQQINIHQRSFRYDGPQYLIDAQEAINANSKDELWQVS